MTTMKRIPLSPNSSHRVFKVFAPELSVLGRVAEIREEAETRPLFSRAWELLDQVATISQRRAAKATA